LGSGFSFFGFHSVKVVGHLNNHGEFFGQS
jgi:hypothetical protein